MNKIIFYLLSLMILVACKTKPYLNNSSSIKKVGDVCTDMDQNVKMNSNINGERYEFYKCLNRDYDSKGFTIERKGDTISVRTKDTPGNRSLYKITLDIDTYPRYNFLDIDGSVMMVVPTSS